MTKTQRATAKAKKEGASDDLNPTYTFSVTKNNLLKKLATGELNAKELAGYEMANRGLGRNGKWVGFEAAKKIWGSK